MKKSAPSSWRPQIGLEQRQNRRMWCPIWGESAGRRGVFGGGYSHPMTRSGGRGDALEGCARRTRRWAKGDLLLPTPRPCYLIASITKPSYTTKVCQPLREGELTESRSYPFCYPSSRRK